MTTSGKSNDTGYFLFTDEEAETNPSADEAALVGRVFMDTEDGQSRIVTHVGFDNSVGGVVAYYHAVGELPEDPVGFDYAPVEDLLEADWVEWEDGNPGRLSEMLQKGSSTLEPNSEQLALVGRTYDDIADGGTHYLFDVSVRTNATLFPWPTYIPKPVVEKLRTRVVVARWGTGRTWYPARVFYDVPTECIEAGGKTEYRFCVCYEDSASCFLNCPQQMISDDMSKAMQKTDNHESTTGDWLMYDDGAGRLGHAGENLVKVLVDAAEKITHSKKATSYSGGCRGSEFVAAHMVVSGEDAPPVSERESWNFVPADELLAAEWAKWHGPSPALLFARSTLAGASLVADDSTDEAGKLELALIEIPDSDSVSALHETSIAIPYRIRKDLHFHPSVSITLDGGRGATLMISRIRDLAEDSALVFHISNKKVLFRAEDFFTDSNGTVMVWGCNLYTYAQLLETGTERGDFPSGFDFNHELIEGTFPGMLPLVDVCGFMKVVMSSRYRNTGKGDQLHQEDSFVDDDGTPWKFVPRKMRSGPENSNESTPKRRKRQL